MSTAPARWRGTAAGLLTAALTVAAHGAGGGGIPVGADIVVLLVVAVTVGVTVASMSRGNDARVVGVALAAGQLAGHAVLTTHIHPHVAGPPLPAWSMVAAHLTAIVAGSALIAIGEHLCRALSHAVPRVAPPASGPVAASRPPAPWSADHPMPSTLLLAFSMPHRGPPASSC